MKKLSLNSPFACLVCIILPLLTTPSLIAQNDLQGEIRTVQTNDPFPGESFLTTVRKEGKFALVENGIPAGILVSPSDFPGVLRVAELFRSDLSHVSGVTASMLTEISASADSETMIIAGTVGKSSLIDQLISSGKLDASQLKDKWEQFVITTVRKPMEGIDNALIIAGSDKRGTMYGMLALSEQMGVSPWYWWADVPVQMRSDIYVKKGVHTLGEPSVKYRGIFINDEAPALRNWAEETFGGFNSGFYEKVFELILRNKGNYLWPAMWRPAVFATDDPENLKLADEYGIVISTTHHEPMMRYHEEWSRYNGGAWNYETNEEKLRQFWREGIERMGDLESVVTVGMRGDGDEAMSEDTAVPLMKRIIKDQREIIEEVTGRPARETPQVWAIYKEVQDYYDKGMRVDEDILVLFCDDNWGNIRILPKKEELDHDGGYGMYYHFDFVGGPVSYRWINVTQIERVWEQMNLAYQWGVEDLWIVNVGDIKPMELPISFFLDFAWDTKIGASDLPGYYQKWARIQFGETDAQEIAEITALYTKYSARRTPEMLKPDTYSLQHYREAERVLGEYDRLLARSSKVYEQLAEEQKDAYYQLVHFPILISDNLNRMYVAAGKNRLYALQNRASANMYAEKVKEYFFKDAELVSDYHEKLADGKWNHIMSQTHIGYTSWNNPPVNRMPEITYIQVPEESSLGYMVEHGQSRFAWNTGGIFAGSFSTFDPVNDQTWFLEVFNTGTEKLTYQVEAKNPWISLSGNGGTIEFEEKIYVSIAWDKVPDNISEGEIVLSGAGREFTIKVPVRSGLNGMGGFVENNGVVSMEATAYTSMKNQGDVRWVDVPNLGRTNSSMTVAPANADALMPPSAPVLEYEFALFEGGDLKIDTYLSPTLNYKKEDGLRYAIAIDDEAPQIINIHEGDSIPDWEYPEWWNTSVTDHIRIRQSVHQSIDAGKHILKVWMVDPGVVFQKFVIDAGGLKPSYLGPPASKKIK